MIAAVTAHAWGADIGSLAAEAARTVRLELRIENGRLSQNERTIRVSRDDVVEIAWSADRRTVLHLHGYDVESIIEPGAPSRMSFRARVAGRFPIETHGARHRVIAYLEVHPN